jgi:hypothetical protein
MTYTKMKRGQHGWNLLGSARSGTAMAANSIYGRRYSVVIFDEVHGARKDSSALHHSLAILAKMNPFAIGLTATPVVTDPEDLIGIGKLLNVPGFNEAQHEAIFKEFKSQLNRARKADKTNGSSLRDAVLHRKATDAQLREGASQAIPIAMRQAVEIRNLFARCVIRRTPRRPKGPISAEEEAKYPPHPVESILLAKPSEVEEKTLEGLYEQEVSEGSALRKGESVSLNFASVCTSI